MRVLIVGGSGLISTPLTRLLLARGDEVTHYNRGVTAEGVPAGVTHITGDRTDYPAFEAALPRLDSFDCVIDMVGYAALDASSVVRAVAGRTAQLVFCSTVDVYRKPAGRYPVLESEPREPSKAFAYAYQKARCEEILREAQERHGLNLTLIRPAYTYGEGRGPIHTLGGKTSYLDRIRKGKAVIVHGDGTSFWTACHADDVARAFAAAVGNERTFGRAYHVTGEEWLTWNHYHTLVAEAMDAPPPHLVHIPTDLLAQLTPDAHITALNFCFNNIFDNSAAKNDLAFRYTVPWREGVGRMIAWLEQHNRIENSDDDLLEDALIATWERLREMAQPLPEAGSP